MNKVIKLGKIRTSNVELKDIAKSWIILSIAFSFALTNTTLFSGTLGTIFSIDFLKIIVVSLFTAGLGFLFHELAHKFTAQHYGCVAEFRAFDQMLYLALGLAATIGVIFAAPGAVMISGMITRKENGVISLAGPLTNYFLAIVFFGLSMIYPLLSIGFFINAWLGLFNLIPFLNFDGKKILNWNRYVWLGMVIIGIVFVFLL